MTLLEQSKKYQYLAMTFDEIQWPSPTISHLIGSNDGLNWIDLKQYDFGWRDPSLAKYQDYWFVCYTGGIARTKDWETFESLGAPLEATGCYTWAPEWVIDAQGWHLIYAQNQPNTDDQTFNLYVVDFDPDSGRVKDGTKQPVNVDCVQGSPIDPNVNIINGQYYLWVREKPLELQLYRANELLGPYEPIATNFLDIQKGLADEGPEMIQIDGQWILFSDPWGGWIPKRRLHYSKAIDNDLTNWSTMQPIEGLSFMPRHFGIVEQFAAVVKSMNSLVADLNTAINQNETKFNSIKNVLNDTSLTESIGIVDSGYLDRSLYLQLVSLFPRLNKKLASVAQLAKTAGVTDDNGYPYVAPSLSVPTGLAIDDVYLGIINENFSMISQFLDQIEQRIV